MKNKIDALATAMRNVVGSRLRDSGLGTVWHDDVTWRAMAAEVVEAFAGDSVVLSKEEHRKLVTDANQMQVVRARVKEWGDLKARSK